MQRCSISITALLLLTLAVSAAAATEVIDRIVAIVNGKLILQSDVEQEARIEAFLAGQQPAEYKPEDLQGIVDRMIDRQLVHEQMRSVREVATTSQAVERRMKQLRESLGKAAESDSGWHKTLADAAISEADVGAHYADEVQTMRFLEARLRPQIQVDAASVESYYRDKLLPELQRSGGREVPLSEVSSRIREILVEQKLDESLTQWLKSLREQSEIRIPTQMENKVSEAVPQAQ
jgi:peptidyl-prolyl cis-trans isomerase SurA